jgi:hypothetical protein
MSAWLCRAYKGVANQTSRIAARVNPLTCVIVITTGVLAYDHYFFVVQEIPYTHRLHAVPRSHVMEELLGQILFWWVRSPISQALLVECGSYVCAPLLSVVWTK